MFIRLAEQKASIVVEDHLQPDRVHILPSIPPQSSVSLVVGFIKGKSVIRWARVYGERKQESVARSLWRAGFWFLP